MGRRIMLDNKYVDKMVYCQDEECSDYFYQMGTHDKCPKCRLK